MLKTYYQLKMTQNAPLRIGNGNAEETDNDLLLDGRGMPFVPGSALTGVLREMVFEKYDKNRDDFDGRLRDTGKYVSDKIFGFVGKDGLTKSSSVLVSDATLDANVSDLKISIRDGIGLDDWGMTIKGDKYNFQIVETQEEYTAIVESDIDDGQLMECLENVLYIAVNDGLRFGARSTRGYGRMSVSVKKKVFDLSHELSEWLDFNPYSEDAFDKAELFENSNIESDVTKIVIGFEIDGSMIIRVKEANHKQLEDGTNPDIMTLKNINGNPVIPGTSWAGSFRHHMRMLYKQANDNVSEEDLEKIDLLFGKHSDGKEHKKSIICFSESEITGGKPHTSMRNSVDRFTAAPINASLFTTQVWKNGVGELIISYKRNKLKDEDKQLLAVTIMDLVQGLLTVGGEVGLGRGRLKVLSVSVNGNNRMEDMENYNVKGLLEE